MTQPGEEISQELLRLFPRQGEWTEADYFNLPETNRIVELSKGRLIITPSPTDQHQKILVKLSFFIYSYLLDNNLGEFRCSPLDVRLYHNTIRQPDIVFMSDKHKDRITEKYWGVPDLAMEILSESTAKEDRTEKFYEYAKAGILEYWLVDPFRQSIEVYTLESGAYVLLGKWGLGETAKSKLLDGFGVSVDEMMA